MTKRRIPFGLEGAARLGPRTMPGSAASDPNRRSASVLTMPGSAASDPIRRSASVLTMPGSAASDPIRRSASERNHKVSRRG